MQVRPFRVPVPKGILRDQGIKSENINDILYFKRAILVTTDIIRKWSLVTKVISSLNSNLKRHYRKKWICTFENFSYFFVRSCVCARVLLD